MKIIPLSHSPRIDKDLQNLLWSKHSTDIGRNYGAHIKYIKTTESGEPDREAQAVADNIAAFFNGEECRLPIKTVEILIQKLKGTDREDYFVGRLRKYLSQVHG